MALPDYIAREFGTAIVWGEAGASGVTKTLTLDALAAGSARMGASADLGATWDPEYLLEIRIETGTAPTAGGTVDVYLAWSRDNSNWPGGVTGSDGAWPTDGNEDEWAVQLEHAGSLVATNDGTVIQTQAPIIINAKARYVAVVVDNNLSQAIRDETTATDNDSRIILTPIRLSVVDT